MIDWGNVIEEGIILIIHFGVFWIYLRIAGFKIISK